LTFNNAPRVTAPAAKHHLPAIYFGRLFATNGGLISYAPNIPDLFFRAGGSRRTSANGGLTGPSSDVSQGPSSTQSRCSPVTVSAHLNIGSQAPAHVGSHFEAKAVNRPCCLSPHPNLSTLPSIAFGSQIVCAEPREQ
jgi:hypothetical protein